MSKAMWRVKRTHSARTCEYKVDITLTLFRFNLFSLYWDDEMAGVMLMGLGLELYRW